MKKLTILFSILLLVRLTDVFGQQYLMTKPEGFGAGTTGGGSASPTTVTTESAFKSALTASGSGVILVSGTITFSAMMKAVVTNKTILGLPGARLVNNVQTKDGSGVLYLQNGSNNVIIRNLTFEGPGAYDVDGNDNLTVDGCTKLWVDHCEFQDGMDGNYDNKGNTDNVTVSWCKFTYKKAPKAGGSGGTDDHRFSDLIGSNASNYPADGHYSITWQNCYWADGCKERMPRARNSELHLLNCYYNTSVSASLAIGLGGGDKNTTCYVENCDFAKIATVYKNYNSTDGGTVGIVFSGCLSGGTSSGTASKPSYTTSSFAASMVATAIPNASCGAGATLKISSNGTISSSCITTDIESESISNISSSLAYPNPSTGAFTVRGKEGIKALSILNLNGEVVYANQGIAAGNEVEIVEELKEGVYFIQLQLVSGTKETIKFVKAK